MRRRGTLVRLTEHAVQQCRARGGDELNPVELSRRLAGKLRDGAIVKNGAVDVPLGGGLYAVLVPDPRGGWACVTVVRPGA